MHNVANEGQKGNLALTIECRDCGSKYELNPECVALALICKASVWEWIESIQNSRCQSCEIPKDKS